MKQKWVKRIARVMLPCFVFFVFSFSFAPKAYAVEFTGTVRVGFKDYHYHPNLSGIYVLSPVLPATNITLSPDATIYLESSAGGNRNDYGDFYFDTLQEQEFASNVKLYVSYIPILGGGSIDNLVRTEDYFDLTNWDISYVNTYGQTAKVSSLDSLKEFDTSMSFALWQKGYALECSWVADTINTIHSLSIVRPDYSGFYNKSATELVRLKMNFPSVRVITTEYTAEMEQLDKVADAIIEQNDILLAMKGDLVAILQDIYQMTGDMYIAQNLLNGYVQQMLPLLESINTQSINIYNLLSSQLRALETAIETAATSIEAAISAQTAAMIAYLESVLNTGNEVPDDTYQQQQDAANILDQMESLEKPNVDTIVPEIGVYTDSGVSGVLSAIFSSNLIVTMMTLSASFAFGAYVLFGKRE